MVGQGNEGISPFAFVCNICPNCQQEALILKDQYGNTTNFPIYSATRKVCLNCGKEYHIQWKQIDGKFLPFPLLQEKKKEVEKEMIEYALSQTRKLD